MLLEIKAVSKRFGGLQALQDLSLAIGENKITGLIGPNGAGKTTLFNVITGFHRPDAGTIFFQNEELTHLPTHEICKKGISRTFQIAKPFEDLTVHKTVTIGALVHCDKVKKAEDRADELLTRLKLDHKRDALGKNLNVVERKRLEMARALASRPKLLLIDEVIAGLNPAEVDEISEIIKGLVKDGISIFMIEHVMRAILTLTEKAIVLDAGKKIAEGEPQALLSDLQVIEAYIGRE
jgi:branched-chain amino acid transport system ATP-binding protein